MLNEPGEELAQVLGEPLPADALLSNAHAGPARVIVPTKRTCLSRGEPLTVKVIMLDKAPAQKGAVHWRVLGTGSFAEEPLSQLARNTYTAQVPEDRIAGSDIEYYVEMVASDGETIRWPASAGTVNQTVVIGPK
jgi:hypothetical protein